MKKPHEKNLIRCHWAQSELNIPYHDEEWGVPVHDEKKWFEFLILEGAQAGLSWDTILRKRARYREVFDGFDPEKAARYDKKKVRELLRDAGIIRNKLKIAAAIGNAQAFVPAKTAESDALSKDLQKRGFRFVGSTICYALMQATGMVNDHMVDCFRYAELSR